MTHTEKDSVFAARADDAGCSVYASCGTMQCNWRVHISHFPPGTSKWNEIEHRLFCHITQNWRGKPLRTFETIVALTGNTRTDAGRSSCATHGTGTSSRGMSHSLLNLV